MAKKEPIKAASDADIDAWIKTLGHPSADIAEAPAAGGPDRYQGILGSGPLEGVQRGLAKEGASLAVNTARLGNRAIGLVSPSLRSRLSDLAEQVPGMKGLEAFADAPKEGIGEHIGGFGMDVAGGLGLGEIGVGSKIAQGASMIAPTGRFVRGMGFMPTRWGKVAGAASTAGEAAAKGAIGGAVADPDDPIRGAEFGAAGGAAVPGVSRALGSRMGQFVGGAAARGVPAMGLHALGMHGPGLHLFRHAGSSYHSPLGRWLTRFGHAVFDRAGRVIGYIDPVTGGLVGGRIAGKGARSFASSPGGADANPFEEEDYAPPATQPSANPG